MQHGTSPTVITLHGYGTDTVATHVKSHFKLRAAIGLRATLYLLLRQNSSLFTVTFGEKVSTLFPHIVSALE